MIRQNTPQKNNNIKNKIVNYGDMYINKIDQNKKIYELNKKNIGDLDALYFYDKIKENKKRVRSIPKIVMKQLEEQNEEEEEEDDEDEINRRRQQEERRKIIEDLKRRRHKKVRGNNKYLNKRKKID